MIRDLGEAIGSTVFETVGRALGRAQEQRPLPVDLLESDDAYLAVFDAPGAVASDVQVRYEDDAIVVRVDRFRDFYEGFEMQFPGRGLTLKDDGTLHVRVPKVTDEDESADGNEAEADEDADEDE